MKKLALLLVFSAFIPNLAWPQTQVNALNTIAVAYSWRAMSDNGNFLEVGVSGQDQIAMLLKQNSKHFSLMFSGYGRTFSNGTSISIQISFNDGNVYSVEGIENSDTDGSGSQILADLPDAQVARWTHDLTADQNMIVTFPESSETPWIFNLTGTTPTVTALAKAISDAGLTGLPAPWTPTGNAPANLVTSFSQSNANSAAPSGPNNTSSNEISNSSSVPNDLLARTMAIQAANGDLFALKSLRDDAASGDRSAMFGLGFYYDDLLQKHCPCFEQNPLVQNLLDAATPELSYISNCSFGTNDQSKIDECNEIKALYQKETELYGQAYQQNDIGAESALGSLYWTGAMRSLMFSNAAGGKSGLQDSADPASKRTFEAITEACSKAVTMLGDAASQNWPFAPAQLALIYVSNSPGSDTNAAGCALDDQSEASKLKIQGAKLNDPEALFLLIGDESQNGEDPSSGPWLPKLEALADSGDADALDDLAVASKLFNLRN